MTRRLFSRLDIQDTIKGWTVPVFCVRAITRAIKQAPPLHLLSPTAWPKYRNFSRRLTTRLYSGPSLSGMNQTFPTHTEKATEVPNCLLKEIIPRFGLPKALQSNNEPAFISKIILSGITYSWHLGLRPQSFMKVEWVNETLKKTVAKLCQETSESWLRMPPIALLRV
jgi:hypothetical protein